MSQGPERTKETRLKDTREKRKDPMARVLMRKEVMEKEKENCRIASFSGPFSDTEQGVHVIPLMGLNM